MIALHNLNYIVLGVGNLPEWQRLACDCLGMLPGEPPAPDTLALRLDNQAQRLILETGPEDDLRVAGWQLPTVEALQQYVHRLQAFGIQVLAADDHHRQRRRVQHLYWCRDPNGFVHEFCTGPALAATPFHSELLPGGFVTGDQGLGHILPRALDFQASCEWYEQKLGLGHSDDIIETVAPGQTVHARFFHAAGGRHHSLATAAVPQAKVLTHFMVEVADPDDVQPAYERCVAAGFGMTRLPGHHPNDDMTSFYVTTPSGIALEYGSGGRVVDPDTWQPRQYTQLSDWGHERLASA